MHPARHGPGVRSRLAIGLALALGGAGTVLVAALAPAPAPAGALPDLDQAPPDGVRARLVGRRVHLGFGSRVKNVGTGHLVVTGRRDAPGVDMAAAQTVDGASRPMRATLYYQASPPRVKGHDHWHYRGFTVFELRRARGRGAPVATSRKQGFCLSSMSVRNCERRRPDLLQTQMGLRRGATDTYSREVEGQFIDVTRVRDGTYVLSHTSDPADAIRESSEANNSASVRIRLRRRAGGRVHVSTLRTCPRTRRC